MPRTAVGLGIIATISNGFNLANVNPFYQDIVKGVIIVGALALDVYGRRLTRRARRPQTDVVSNAAVGSPASISDNPPDGS